MRKITSKYREEKKKKRNGLIIGLALMGLMLLSILGYSFQGKDDSVKKVNYNGFKFTEQNGYWFTNIENFQFVFRYNPKQTEKIGSGLNPLDNYSGKPLYIYSKNDEAELEIYRNLFYQNQIILRMQSACLEGEDCIDDLPIKTCEDNFIIIKEGDEDKITQKDNCVFIEGEQDLTKLTDEFLFEIIGIQ